MNKIIQIMPVDNITLVYESEGERFNVKAIALALWEDGELTFIEVDSGGYIDVAGRNIVDVIIN